MQMVLGIYGGRGERGVVISGRKVQGLGNYCCQTEQVEEDICFTRLHSNMEGGVAPPALSGLGMCRTDKGVPAKSDPRRRDFTMCMPLWLDVACRLLQ